jgi:hypothetical protein
VTARLFALLLLALTIGAVVLVARRVLGDGLPRPAEIPRWDRRTVDSLSAGGWAERFDGPLAGRVPLTEYDSTWVPIFGRLEVDPKLGAAVASSGMEDDGDDYAFRLVGDPMSASELTVEGWWAGDWQSLGAEAVVQPEPPHRLYEAAFWKGRLDLLHFVGPGTGDYETLAGVELAERPGPGFYRIVFRTEHDGESWQLDARLVAVSSGEELASVEANHAGLPSTGYHGIGLLSAGRALVTGVAVRPLHSIHEVRDGSR